jgi:hypothetical protein
VVGSVDDTPDEQQHSGGREHQAERVEARGAATRLGQNGGGEDHRDHADGHVQPEDP